MTTILAHEHPILPQNPDTSCEWCTWCPDEVERMKEVHRRGNLALLNRRQNSAASNWDFGKKKTKYFLGRSGSGPFALTTEVVAREKRTPEGFDERQQRFLDQLSKEWKLQ